VRDSRIYDFGGDPHKQAIGLGGLDRGGVFSRWSAPFHGSPVARRRMPTFEAIRRLVEIGLRAKTTIRRLVEIGLKPPRILTTLAAALPPASVVQTCGRIFIGTSRPHTAKKPCSLGEQG
jgi:hypothetical protein